MEDSLITTVCEDDWAQEITEALGEGKTRVREFLAAHRARLDQARVELADQIERISQSLEADHGETARAREEIEGRAESVQTQLDALGQLKQDLDTRQSQWEDAHREAIEEYRSLADRFHQEQSQVSELSSQLTSQIDQQYQKLQRQTAELQTALAEQKELLAGLDAARGEGADSGELAEQLLQRQQSLVAELSSQLASQIDERHVKLQEQTAEFQSALADQKQLLERIDAAAGREGQLDELVERLEQQQKSQAAEFSSQLAARIDEQYGKLHEQTAELQSALAGQKELLTEIESARAREAELNEQIETLRRQYDQLREEAAQAARDAGVDTGQLEALRTERDELAEQLRQQQKSQVAEFSSQLAAQIDEQHGKLQEQTAELQSALAGQKELLAEIESARAREAELNEHIETLRRQYDQLREEAAQAARDSGVDTGQLEALRTERDELAEQLRQQQKSQVAEFSSQVKARIDEQYERLQEQAAELQSSLVGQKELLAEIESARARETELNQQIDSLRRQYDELREESSRRVDGGDGAGAIERLQGELAEQLRQQQAEQIAEFTARLKIQIDEQYQHLHERTAELQIALASQSELIAEVESGHRREAELKEEMESLREECGRLKEEASQAAGRATESELEAVEAERDGLASQLGEMEGRLMAAIDRFAEAEARFAAASGGEGGSDDGETDRRYQMAMEDLRELRARNEELEQQLASAKDAAPAGGSGGGGLDWEAQKRRILASLESDDDEEVDEEEKARRLEVEEVVEKTDAIVAERESEIRELKQLLEAQSSTHNDLAVGAAALGDILNKDEVIQEEREKLHNLQAEWEEKLRKAELELSVERAKIARERTHVEERLRTLEERGGEAGEEGDSDDSKEDTQPKRGRWLTRLGLKDP